MNRLLKAFCIALAFSALYNFRGVVNAVSSFYPPPADHSIVPPGAYAWTPEHGLRPLIDGSPTTPAHR